MRDRKPCRRWGLLERMSHFWGKGKPWRWYTLFCYQPKLCTHHLVISHVPSSHNCSSVSSTVWGRFRCCSIAGGNMEVDFETKSPTHFVLSVCVSHLWLRMHAPNFPHACCHAYLPPHQDELLPLWNHKAKWTLSPLIALVVAATEMQRIQSLRCKAFPVMIDCLFKPWSKINLFPRNCFLWAVCHNKGEATNMPCCW